MPSQAGPDFICIGAEKGGTRWLYDQLEHHPDFRMPAVKELQYLHGEPAVRRARRLLRAMRDDFDALRAARLADHLRPLDDEDPAWLRLYIDTARAPRDADAYAALFAFKREKLSGDISPPYACLDRAGAQAIRRRFPAAKILYLARDPVKRAWSQFCMYRAKDMWFDRREAAGTFAQFLQHEDWRRKSSITHAVDAWRTDEADENFALFFLDDIAANAVGTRGRILALLGADPLKPSGPIPPSFNRKDKVAKPEIQPDQRAALLAALADEIVTCARRFGGPARAWMAHYGLSDDGRPDAPATG